MLAAELKVSTDALSAEVAQVISLSGAVTPDADVQAGIDAINKATADLQAKFPQP